VHALPPARRTVSYPPRPAASPAARIDPGEVRLSGEHSLIALATGEDASPTTRASHWRVLLSPAGAGHVLFVESELTGGRTRVYADNVALARWLQREVEGALHPPSADATLGVTDAVFECLGEARLEVVERVITPDETITLRWSEFLEPFVQLPPAEGPGGTLRRYGTFIPARTAQVLVNGARAQGAPRQAPHEGTVCTTACLGWAATWVRARTHALADTKED
jgi:hypothetical protein